MTAEKRPKRTTITLITKGEEEREHFREAAEAEGFSTLAAWVMYHLRNQAKQTLSDEREK
ncbi:MAG: hypothetical protein ABGZ53_23100 [Fuerstiella sp.]